MGMKIKTVSRLALIFISFTVLLATGPESLTYPADVPMISLSGAGAADGSSPHINPAAMLSEELNPGIAFSNNNWYSTISGVNISYIEKNKFPLMVYVSNWDTGDIDQYGEIPNDDPIGSVSLHWASAGLGTAFNMKGWNWGTVVKAHFSRMAIESITGVTIDSGIQRDLNESLAMGLSLRNLGFLDSGSLDVDLPIIFTGGIRYIEPVLQSSLMLDIQIRDESTSVHTAIEKDFFGARIMTGGEFSDSKQQFSVGFETDLGHWSFGAGFAFHENSILGTPVYLSIRRNL